MNKNCVMGWDAAWTPQGSGAWCIIQKTKEKWELMCWEITPTQPERTTDRLTELLKVFNPGAVAIDMPVAKALVTGYREADRATTQAFSRFGCPVHSPMPERPGLWGWRCVKILMDHGYYCKTNKQSDEKFFAEVYPHTALLKLVRCAHRVPYKYSRSGKYWPDKPPAHRKKLLLKTWSMLFDQVGEELGFEANFISLPDQLKAKKFKPIEDRLDALICAWAGLQIMEQRFDPFGDEEAAIWNPQVKELDLFNSCS